MEAGTVLLIVAGGILLIVLIVLLGGGMAAGGMAMMAGMMSNPIGWLVLLILAALIALIGYLLFYQGDQQTGAQALRILSMIGMTRGLFPLLSL